jgi:hypothetical protein
MNKEQIEKNNVSMLKEYGILQEIKELKLEDNAYTGKVNLPSWKDYTLEGETPNNGIINIRIGQAYADDVHSITTADVNGVAGVLGWAENHQKLILEKLLEVYPQWQKDYGYSEEEAKQFMPNVTSIEEFKKLIKLANIHVLPVEHEGIAYIGYEFNCHWDVEHGMGAMFHDKRMVELGMAESSFMNSIAERDKDAHKPKSGIEADLVFDKISIQQALYSFTVEGFKNRVKDKPEAKNIYAFAYDFDLTNNILHLSMNTISDHEKTIKEYKDVSYMQDSLNSDAGMHEIKFHPGYYKHCAFEDFIPLTVEQSTQMQKWAEEDSEESLQKRKYNTDTLAEAFSEILAIYSKGEEIKLLPLVDNFYVCAIEHDEMLTNAEERIKKYL